MCKNARNHFIHGFYIARIVLGACMLGSGALAVASIATVDELGAINAETVMLRAQTERENARRALLRAQRDAAVSGCTRAAPLDTLPQARRITSVNGVHEVTLVYPDHQVEVREGDALPGGYIVHRILLQARRVDLKSKAGRIVQIPVSGAVQTREAPAVPVPPPATFNPPPADTFSAEIPPSMDVFAPSAPSSYPQP